MKQSGIGTVVGTTTSDVLRKLKEQGQEGERRSRAAPGRDTISISPEARELMTQAVTAENGEETEEDVTTPD